jgi:hypothetical protein
LRLFREEPSVVFIDSARKLYSPGAGACHQRDNLIARAGPWISASDRALPGAKKAITTEGTENAEERTGLLSNMFLCILCGEEFPKAIPQRLKAAFDFAALQYG